MAPKPQPRHRQGKAHPAQRDRRKAPAVPRLRLDPRNARKHPDRNKALIRQSLEEIGAFRSIAADGEGIVRAGNGVYEQAQALGFRFKVIDARPDELVVVRRPDLKGKRAERAALLDNRSGETSEWDASVIADLAEREKELLDGLFDPKELEGILARAASEAVPGETGDDPGAQFEKADRLVKQWGVRPGDLWEIPSQSAKGKSHRLLCGDSTDVAQVARLMGGKRAVLFATDPPYLVDYDGTNHPHKWNDPQAAKRHKNKDWGDTYHDWDDSAQGEGLYDGFIAAAKQAAITPSAAWYCWHASRRQAMLERVWEKHGVFVHQQIVWVKDRPVLTRSWYLWQHEPCLFGWTRGKKPKRTAKDYPPTVWEHPTLAPGQAADHPTQKPVELFAVPIRQHTAPGEICYEPFSGSGTQFVAAEQLGRLCYGLEREPRFVAVILERLAGLGLAPKRVEGDREKKRGMRPGVRASRTTRPPAPASRAVRPG